MTRKKQYVIHGHERSYRLELGDNRRFVRMSDDSGRLVDWFRATPELLKALVQLALEVNINEEEKRNVRPH